MKILAGYPCGKSKVVALSMGLGSMFCTSNRNNLVTKSALDFPFTAIDNGAFGCFKKGVPFNEKLFLENVERAQRIDLKPLFIVTPDIVAGGLKSLELSLRWREKIEYGKKALVVQDGMECDDIRQVINLFDYLFIGGSVAWKWRTAEDWVKFAHENNTPCHIGQCGQSQMLRRAYEIGADSVDSTSWVVNGTWHIVRNFLSNRQCELF